MNADEAATTAGLAASREFALTCNPAGLIAWADARAARILGAAAGASLLDYTVADSHEKCLRFLDAARLQRTDSWELMLCTADGQPVLFDCLGLPHQDAILVVGTQLPGASAAAVAEMSGLVSEIARLQRETQQQQLETQRLSVRLARERQLLRGVLDQMSSGVLVVNARTGALIVVNAPLETLLGPTEPTGDAAVADRQPAAMRDLVALLTTPAPELVAGPRLVRVALAGGTERVLELLPSPAHDLGGETIAIVGVVHDITAHAQRQQQLERESLHDPLTGLPNRRMVELQLTRALARARRGATDVALLFLDLDGFKRINDTIGHQAGDAVLREVARRLATTTREGDMAARLAGDEFVVLLESVPTVAAAAAAAERLLRAFDPPMQLDDQTLTLSPSIGVAVSPSGAVDRDALFSAADEAMYQAKRAGKARYAVYTPGDGPR